MPSRSSSQAVSRAPCSSGRVSSTHTEATRPCWCAVAMTPSAVPQPAVASAPVLQWVSTRSCWPEQRRAVGGESAVGGDVVLLQALRPLGERGGSDRAPPAARAAKTPRPRSSAQRRLTAVGRVAMSSAKAASKASRLAVGADLAHRQHQPPGGGDPDRRRPAHRQPPDGVRNHLRLGAVDPSLLGRKQGLVQKVQGPFRRRRAARRAVRSSPQYTEATRPSRRAVMITARRGSAPPARSRREESP